MISGAPGPLTENGREKSSLRARRWLWTTAGVALAVTAWLMWAWGPEAARRVWRAAAPALGQLYVPDSSLPVEIELHDKASGETLRLRIPRPVLATKHWGGGRQEVVHLRTNLSELIARQRQAQGLPPPNIDIRDPPGWGPGRNDVYVHLWSGKRLADGPRRSYDSTQRRTTYIGHAHGLEHYRYTCENYVDNQGEKRQVLGDCAGLRNDYFVTAPGTPDEFLDFSCVRPEDNPRGGCVVTASHRGWSIQYIFGRTELYRWKEVDGAVRSLIDGFVASAS